MKDMNVSAGKGAVGTGHKTPQKRRTGGRKLVRAGAENSGGQDGNKVMRTGEQISPDVQIS